MGRSAVVVFALWSASAQRALGINDFSALDRSSPRSGRHSPEGTAPLLNGPDPVLSSVATDVRNFNLAVQGAAANLNSSLVAEVLDAAEASESDAGDADDDDDSDVDATEGTNRFAASREPSDVSLAHAVVDGAGDANGALAGAGALATLDPKGSGRSPQAVPDDAEEEDGGAGSGGRSTIGNFTVTRQPSEGRGASEVVASDVVVREEHSETEGTDVLHAIRGKYDGYACIARELPRAFPLCTVSKARLRQSGP